jgi:putative ABC transport system permease protein
MLRNHLVVAFRNLHRHRGFSFISIASLAISLSVCLLLVLIVHQQRSYDRHHEGADRLYRVLSANDNSEFASSPAPMGPALAEQFAGVESYTRLRRFGTDVLIGGGGVEVEGIYAEPAFFDLFDWPVQPGGSVAALAEPYQVLLTAELAQRLFKEHDPVGASIELRDIGEFTVAGVLEPPRGPTHLRPDMVASFATPEARTPELLAAWRNSMWTTYTYLRLSPAFSPGQLAPALASISTERFVETEGDAFTFRLQPVTGIAFGPLLNNEIARGPFPGIVGLFLTVLMGIVLVAACFNFTNLSLARAFERVKEVGVRKTLGARRAEVASQFVVEAVVLSLLGLGLAMLFLPLLAAGFNSLTMIQMEGLTVPLELFQPGILASFVGVALLLGLLAGFYPAVVLSSPRPIHLMSASLPAIGGKGRLRRVLLGGQLFLSFVLIASTLLLYQQGEFMRTGDYGIDTDRLVYVETRGAPVDVLRQELATIPGVETVAGLSPYLPLTGSISAMNVRLEGQEAELSLTQYLGDEHVLDALGVSLVAGSMPALSDAPSELVINETAARLLGAGQPADAIGMVLVSGQNSYQVRGVMADFHAGGLADAIMPVMLRVSSAPPNRLLVRADPAYHQAVLAHLEARWADLDPVQALEADVYSAVVAEQVGWIRDMMGMVGAIGLFALLIVGMGLLGVAAYSMQVRTKEIGIRKVLGASVAGLALLLSREFLWLSGLALALGLPVSWLLNGLWLDLFAHRVEIGAGVFVAAALALGLVLLSSVGMQALRTATADPVEALRAE